MLEEAGEEGAEADPLYVKLRAEAGRGLLEGGGSGKLYLGFHIDPVHTVHWNNLAEPLQWEIEPPDGVELGKDRGTAPKVEPEADIDPREFLIDIETGDSVPEEPMLLTVRYFACDDEEGWCRAVTQRYQLFLKRDRDGGRVMSGRGRGGAGGRGAPGPGREGGAGRRPDPNAILARQDRDGDGRVTREEARGQMVQFFDRLDTDGDGVVTKEEIEARFGSNRGR